MGLTLLDVAGVLAVMAALGHGFLGDRNLRSQPIAPESFKNFVRVCYQFGTAGWLTGAVLLFMADRFPVEARPVLIIALVPLYGLGALANLWFTRGRHPGWIMLAAICVLTVVGLG